MLIAGMVLVGLIVASALVDRKVEAAERQEELEEYIEAICEPRHICPELIEATIERESQWNPKAINGDCIGLMQISERWHRGAHGTPWGDRLIRPLRQYPCWG